MHLDRRGLGQICACYYVQIPLREIFRARGNRRARSMAEVKRASLLTTDRQQTASQGWKSLHGRRLRRSASAAFCARRRLVRCCCGRWMHRKCYSFSDSMLFEPKNSIKRFISPVSPVVGQARRHALMVEMRTDIRFQRGTAVPCQLVHRQPLLAPTERASRAIQTYSNQMLQCPFR